MTETEYQKLLDSHDWWYRYADDPAAYERGMAHNLLLARIAESDERLKALYEEKLASLRG